jgi:putative transcriptional regulator
MTIHHHPSDGLLTEFAAGVLDLGQHVAIATHLANCSRCRVMVRTTEHVGGAVLAALPPTAMADGSFEAVEARLNEAALSVVPPNHSGGAFADVAGLPRFLRSFPETSWKWIAPKVHLRPIQLPHPSATRVFLLRSSPGTKMVEHTHSGFEMTCVLSGSFVHAGGHFGPGDFDFGDGSVDHDVTIDSAEDCVCLVAMQGDLRMHGLIGRLLQPLIRM